MILSRNLDSREPLDGEITWLISFDRFLKELNANQLAFVMYFWMNSSLNSLDYTVPRCVLNRWVKYTSQRLKFMKVSKLACSLIAVGRLSSVDESLLLEFDDFEVWSEST
mmetsp:Transcript_2257/g.3972  ORF Transcript_2257/g.3972 Transcript_2257/m.3972 type:complete len:110 (-) Transcript_2257:334-663(-)